MGQDPNIPPSPSFLSNNTHVLNFHGWSRLHFNREIFPIYEYTHKHACTSVHTHIHAHSHIPSVLCVGSRLICTKVHIHVHTHPCSNVHRPMNKQIMKATLQCTELLVDHSSLPNELIVYRYSYTIYAHVNSVTCASTWSCKHQSYTGRYICCHTYTPCKYQTCMLTKLQPPHQLYTKF